ncbi:MAG TPA: guanylate kinase [Bacillota bacterium]|jgi:guanylate kinase|nr:guanylate kinase [Bacillota bacterium]HOA35355.1 guanylate kinase [Bacillota bacterium]HPZ11545.1 guanylate kinase [Bacillota bacterium]HQE09976.1 guanylate kinase [Bacillota bacterium]
MAAGLLVVLSGPSGVGKGTVCERLRLYRPSLQISLSMTTRPPRPGELAGRNYDFTTPARFKELISRDAFLEWAVVYGHYYGTPREAVEKNLALGRELLLEIDVQGALQVRRRMAEAVLIFLAPPSMEALCERITGRATEEAVHIKRRLQAAQQEMAAYHHYDYLVVNDQVEKAAASINAIIEAEKCRISRGVKPPGWGGEKKGDLSFD